MISSKDVITTPSSIPSLASRLGVTPPAVRNWIKHQLIPSPSVLTATGERAYAPEAVREIEVWYAERASTRSTRGPGAANRRDRAEAFLAQAEREGSS